MVATLEQTAKRRLQYAVIDCDIHPSPKSQADVDKFLPERWRRHRQQFGSHSFAGSYYPRAMQNAARADAFLLDGSRPGCDLDFMRYQLLDAWQMEYGILQPLAGAPGAETNLEYGAALASALNEWQIEYWLEPEPRLRSGLLVPYEDAELSVKEIERRGMHPGFVQVLLLIRTSEPLGRRKYWRLYEAAEAYDLPIGIHFGSQGGHPITGCGWPSMYLEDHAGMSTAFQAQVISYIFEGVFEQFPKLKIVLVEGGFAWLPTLGWRMDRAWEKLEDEVPHLKRKPSEYLKEHFWITTQPMEEPHTPDHFLHLLDQAPWLADRLMFATDYPHWDFDAPDEAMPKIGLPDEFVRNVMAENARQLYKLA